MHPLFVLIPVLAGVLQPVIWGMNLRMDRASGAVEAATILHLVGAVTGLGYWILGLRGQGFSGLGAVPVWAWFGGAVGLSCMAMVTRAMPMLGAAATLAIMVAAQFSASILFEHYGWLGLEIRPATWGKLLGAGLLALGAWLIAR